MKKASILSLLVFVICHPGSAQEADEQPIAKQVKTLKVLFIGNSYTARHNLAEVVKSLAEADDPNLFFHPTQVIYGGRILRDHWRLGTQHLVNRHRVTANEVQLTIAELEMEIAKHPADKYSLSGLKQMKSLLAEIEDNTIDRSKWDLVVLQSYRDDLEGEASLYMQFAPRFAELAKAQGARVLLYETTPTTQNQAAIVDQNPTSVIEKAKVIAQLAKQTGALVAPMSYVALRCQKEKPEITLRFENDAHLNQTMAYLTACTIYAAIFDRSPEGLPVDSVTDIRFLNDDRSTGKDRDGKPIAKEFSEQERDFLQSTAWKALQEFKSTF